MKPTCQLRILRDHEWISDERSKVVDMLQQLWTSDTEDEEDEWRDVEIVDMTHTNL
jgi:hypothetical protein